MTVVANIGLAQQSRTTRPDKQNITMLLKNVFTAAALASTAFAAPAEQKRQSKLKWFGINESGAEFGETKIPGLYNKDYTWYDTKTIDQFIGQGMNMFRLNFRRTPNRP